MKTEKTLEVARRKIRDLKANEENKGIVLKFDELNRKNEITISTRRGYLSLLRHLLAFCGERHIGKLSGEDLQEFFGQLQERKIYTQENPGFRNGKRRVERLCTGSRNTYLQKIKKFFRWYYNTGTDTPEIIKKSGLRQGKDNFKLTTADLPTEQEICAMINATENPLYKAILAVMYDSGMRINDILDLKIKDLVVSENEVRLRFFIRKTKQHLLYGLGSSVGYLMNWYNLHPTKKAEDYLFCTMATNWRGKRMGYGNIYQVVKRMAKKAGMTKEIHCHIFRHCATARDKPNYSEEELCVLRGWSRTSQMPRRYASISADEVFKKKKILEGKVRPEPERKVIDARSCPRCKNAVTPDSAYCCVCGQLLKSQPSELNEILASSPNIMQQIITEVTKDVERRMKYQKLAEERFKVMMRG